LNADSGRYADALIDCVQVTVTYRDVDLAMTSRRDDDVSGGVGVVGVVGRCVDWLLVQSVGFSNSAAMTCGRLQSSATTSTDPVSERSLNDTSALLCGLAASFLGRWTCDSGGRRFDSWPRAFS